MSTTLYTKVDYTLAKLIEDIDMGELALPDIQRPFVWSASKVRDLFDSMYRGYPVGYLLFWENDYQEHTREIGTDNKQKIPKLLIVDGQQRLTSLFAVLKKKSILTKDFKEKQIIISFNPRDGGFKVADASTRRNPDFITNISDVWDEGGSLLSFVSGYLSKLRESKELEEGEERQISDRIERLYKIKDYPFTAIELSKRVDEEQVSQVFVRINSKGVTLNQADFILTLMSVFWDEGRVQLERFCRDSRKPVKGEPSPYNHFIEPDPDQLLRVAVGLGFYRARLKYVYNILRGKDLETGEYSSERRKKQFGILKKAQAYTLDIQNWHEYFKALMSAGFRSGDMVTSKTTLIYCYMLFLIGKHDYRLDHNVLRNTIGQWFFMSSVTGRYTGSPETAMERDLRQLKSINYDADFVNLLQKIIRDNLTEDFWRINLPNALDSSAAYSPALFAYHAAQNILNTKALFSDLNIADLQDSTTRAHKSGVERHHLFPKAYLDEKGYQTQDINQIANYAYVEWKDNIDISDKPPSEYIHEYLSRFKDGEKEKVYELHALPENWHEMKYEDFLEDRRKKMAQVIRKGFKKLSEKI